MGTAGVADRIVDLLPSPEDRPFPATRISGETLAIAPDSAAPLAALVFKTLNDPFTGKLSIVRVAQGTLSADTALWNVRLEESEKASGLLFLQGKQGIATPKLHAGDIGAIAKLKSTRSGDTLTLKDRPLHLAWIQIAEPAKTFA